MYMREQQKFPMMKVTDFSERDAENESVQLKDANSGKQLKKGKRPGAPEGFINIRGNVYIFINVDLDDIR